MVERIFHPREELEIFSHLIYPESRLNLEVRHRILTVLIAGGYILLLCRGKTVTDEVRKYLFQVAKKIPIAHLHNTKALSKYSLDIEVSNNQISIIDRFEEASIGDVDLIIQAGNHSTKAAGIIVLAGLDPLTSIEDIFEDLRFAELAVSGFFLFLIEDFMLAGIDTPVIKEPEKTFQYFLTRFDLEE